MRVIEDGELGGFLLSREFLHVGRYMGGNLEEVFKRGGIVLGQ